jgi:hypothetical protein
MTQAGSRAVRGLGSVTPPGNMGRVRVGLDYGIGECYRQLKELPVVRARSAMKRWNSTSITGEGGSQSA